MIKIAFPYLEISRVVRASPNRVWGLLTDTFAWGDWGPSILAVRSSDRYIRNGSHGRVKTALGFWVPFEVTHLDSGKYWSWRIFGVSATGHRIDRLDQASCRLVFQVPIWAAPYLLVCKISLDRIVQLLDR
ncbi:MAG: SRPBCC family protein [Deltaproteobacteria bacterium]|nr:MAG: SRPBCC family protein [Deltaproteobacteria bacterium]